MKKIEGGYHKTEYTKKEIDNMREANFIDITISELKKEWLNLSSLVSRGNASEETKNMAREAKRKYFEATGRKR